MSSPEVIVVGALATKVSNIAPLRYTAEAIGSTPKSIHYVQGGIANGEGGYNVASISDQEAQITEIISANPEKGFIILSQSMGALAALNCVEKFGDLNVNNISIAPPLLKPGEIVRSERIMTRSKQINGRLFLPSYSFALGDSGPGPKADNPMELAMLDNVFTEIDAATPDYWDRVQASNTSGRLHVIMPTEDWNQTALEVAQDLPAVTYLPGPHSLITDEPILRSNIATMVEIAHQMHKDRR